LAKKKLGKERFAECQNKNTRQKNKIFFLGNKEKKKIKKKLCRVPHLGKQKNPT